MIYQSEVQRIENELVRTGVSGEVLMRRFRSASRADVKLACALQGYFTESNEPYLAYIRSRLRPALTELTLSGRTEEMAKLDAMGLMTAALAEPLLEQAIDAHVPDSIVWLLKWKESHVGFENREFRLKDD